MFEKITHRAMWVFGILTALPTVGITIWGLYFGCYYVLKQQQVDMGTHDGNWVAALVFTSTGLFAILWGVFFGLHYVAEEIESERERKGRWGR